MVIEKDLLNGAAVEEVLKSRLTKIPSKSAVTTGSSSRQTALLAEENVSYAMKVRSLRTQYLMQTENIRSVGFVTG